MQNRRMFLSRLGVATTIGATGFISTGQALGATPGSGESTTDNAATCKPEFVQPDYAAWAKVKEGMPEADVLRLLGEPLERGKPPEKSSLENESVIRAYPWIYGRIDCRSPLVPEPFRFYILLGNGRVIWKQDPFRPPLSTDGKPTVPQLIYPVSGAIYDHYPRYLDLRWYPSSGKYPMHYLVEYQMGNPAYGHERDWYPPGRPCQVDIPYALLSHSSKGRGRWRVRAMNSLGESDWSEYRDFTFGV